ncbi:MAG: hypothetical protein WAM74_11970, partial [Xanthobacteraceae bacterium]
MTLTDASVSDRNASPFALSRNKEGWASINSAANRFSSSCPLPPVVNGRGEIPNAMAEIARTNRPFPLPDPDTPGAV